jgi:hypothetical protein
VTVAEARTVALEGVVQDVAVSATDTVLVSESRTVVIPTVSIADAIVLSESNTLSLPINASVSDAISVSETIAPSIPAITRSDAVVAIESVVLSFPLNLSVIDAALVGESRTISIITVVVQDSVAVAESVSAQVGGATIDRSVSDAISVLESVVVALDHWNVNASDAVSVQETATALIPISVNVTDGVATADSTTLSILLTVNASDQVSVSDIAAALLAYSSVRVEVVDSVSVGENVFATTFLIAIPTGQTFVTPSGISSGFSIPESTVNITTPTVETTIAKGNGELEDFSTPTSSFEFIG